MTGCGREPPVRRWSQFDLEQPLVRSKAVARGCLNAEITRSAKAGEARCGGSSASTGWA